MLHQVTRDLPHYLSLLGILGAGFLGFIYFSYDKSFQAAVVVATSVAYVFWGLVHHHIHEDLYPRVVLEYITTAALGLVILLPLILR